MVNLLIKEMDRLEIAEIVFSAVNDIKPDIENSIETASKTFSDLGLDSLDQMSLILTIQEAFGCTISDDEISELQSIESLVDYLEK